MLGVFLGFLFRCGVGIIYLLGWLRGSGCLFGLMVFSGLRDEVSRVWLVEVGLGLIGGFLVFWFWGCVIRLLAGFLRWLVVAVVAGLGWAYLNLCVFWFSGYIGSWGGL